MPEEAVKFSVNFIVISRFDTPTLRHQMFAGGIASAVSTTCIYPLDIVKTRMTVARNGEYASLYNCVEQTYRSENSFFRAFYKGYVASLIGGVVYNSIALGTYRWSVANYKSHTDQSVGGLADQFLSVGSALLAITTAYPLNLTRTKLQVQGVNCRPVLYKGIRDCLQKTVHHEGVTGLFRGFVPNSFKALPSASILLQVQRRVSECLLEFD
jgi:solute carrier family 25 phosphate transporter 23/24/25/41